MKYYFEDLEEQKKLRTILEEWVGTPYRHHCGVKGLGCDCIHFVARVFEEMGILRWRKGMIPDYPKDWHLHNTREILKSSILNESDVEEVDQSNLMNGDIILSHYGKAASHAAILFDGYVYQSITGIGVVKTNISDDKFRKRIKMVLRLRAK